MTKRNATGLYDPEFERDSCGFGLIANLDDLPSHWVVETAISALARLTHRGAVAADGKTGDGCGLLIKFPVTFLRAVGEEAGISVNKRFAAGTVFLSQDDTLAEMARNEVETAVTRWENTVQSLWREDFRDKWLAFSVLDESILRKGDPDTDVKFMIDTRLSDQVSPT